MGIRSKCKLGATVLIAFFFTLGCEKKDKAPPILSVPFVDTSLTKEFLVFGYQLGPDRFNPAYEIRTSSRSAQVLSATSGKVTRVEYNGGGDDGQDDYEIFIKTKKGSIFTIIYDHVRNPSVSKGEAVSPGTILGDVGWGSGTDGRIELQINNDEKNLAYCPEKYGTETFNQAFETALDFNNIGYSPGDSRYFDSVCLSPTVVP